MAVFFFVVGLEIKYEILKGELSNPRKLALPVLAAVGGMVAPALVYLAFNLGPNGQPGGWPTPAATDIAFALAALAAIGPRLPASLRVFLLTLAIADDLGAVALIAVLFTAKVQVWALAAAGGRAEPVGPLQKAGMWMGTQMNTLTDRSNAHIAEMVIQGATMGIIEMTKARNTCPDADPGAASLASRFIVAQNDIIDRQKHYLREPALV